jgi:hypothetical protein
MLVGIHVALLTIWAKELEHGITFSLDNQKMVNFLITAIANTLGTVRTLTWTLEIIFSLQSRFIRRSWSL